MNANENMFEFLDQKQNAFDEACCAFAVNENMTAIAKEVGMNPTILRSKLNPTMPHKLTAMELMAISKASNNHTLLNCVLDGLDIVTATLPKEAEKTDLFSRALAAGINSGELQSLVSQTMHKINMSRTERHNLIQKCQLGIGNLVMLMSDLENRSGSFTTLVSTAGDMAINGLVPGFS